jgi:hypothetical protein
MKELLYLEQLIKHRLNSFFPSGKEEAEPVMPTLDQWHYPLADFVHRNQLNAHEATLLLAALAPHIKPDLFDGAIDSKLSDPSNFPRLGGVRGKNSRTFLPTGETLLFLLAGDQLQQRLQVQQLFGSEHLFAKRKILWLEELPGGEPTMSGRIIISPDYVDTFLIGKPSPPHFSTTFPAKRIEEGRTWSSLVINDDLKKQLEEIRSWLKYNDQLMHDYGMKDRIKKGYRALFYGTTGTGKTLTAGILGNEMGKEVYKIDLSMVVSKYIGETEKNLEMLFARAEDKGWILFFDEADALFGKRTSVRDAHDKYANQEVSYLLQRIEDYNGLIILATNMKSNIDDAFMRRFNATLRFPFPDAGDRAQIWRKSFPENSAFAKEPVDQSDGADGIDVPELVKKYEMAGGSIINVVHYASLKALERRNGHAKGTNGKLTIYLNDVLQGIQKEMMKEGKPFQ